MFLMFIFAGIAGVVVATSATVRLFATNLWQVYATFSIVALAALGALLIWAPRTPVFNDIRWATVWVIIGAAAGALVKFWAHNQVISANRNSEPPKT